MFPGTASKTGSEFGRLTRKIYFHITNFMPEIKIKLYKSLNLFYGEKIA